MEVRPSDEVLTYVNALDVYWQRFELMKAAPEGTAPFAWRASRSGEVHEPGEAPMDQQSYDEWLPQISWYLFSRYFAQTMTNKRRRPHLKTNMTFVDLSFEKKYYLKIWSR